MRERLIWLVLPLLAGPAAAQTATGSPPPAHQLAVDVGGFWHGLDDHMASPLRYTGRGPGTGASYVGEAGPWRWALRGGVAGPRLSSRLSDSEGSYEEMAWRGASGELLWRAWRNRPFTVWTGAGLAVESAARRHLYVTDAWLNFTNTFVALQAAARAELSLERWGRVAGTFALPVVGVAVREEYAGVIGRARRVSLAAPPAFLFARHRLEYRLPVETVLDVRAFHEATLLRHRDPEPLASVSHRLGMMLVWNWGAR